MSALVAEQSCHFASAWRTAEPAVNLPYPLVPSGADQKAASTNLNICDFASESPRRIHKMNLRTMWMLCLCTMGALPTTPFSYGQGGGTGDVVVRVDDTSGSHCIDADTEKITVFVRRVFTEKHSGLFTQDNKAGVLVRSQLVANSTDQNKAEPSNVQVPSVDMVSVKDDQKGRVSLALEYAIASDFVLSQGNNVTKTMDIYMNLAKSKGKSTFGEVLDLAGQALNQVSLPQNPYTQAGSKFLKFANSAIDTNIKADNDDQIAHIGLLQFKEGEESNLAKV